MNRIPRAPESLSPKSIEVWRQLHQAYSFSAAETVALVEHLRLQDRGDRLEAAGQIKLALSSWALAGRWWRVLKFAADAGAERKPGRPGGAGWSASRRAAEKASTARIARVQGES